MSYYTHEDEVHDFDQYNPTPYVNDYDETCYPSVSDQDEYERPDLYSYTNPSAYVDDALNNEYNHSERPKTRPGPGGNYEILNPEMDCEPSCCDSEMINRRRGRARRRMTK